MAQHVRMFGNPGVKRVQCFMLLGSCFVISRSFPKTIRDFNSILRVKTMLYKSLVRLGSDQVGWESMLPVVADRNVVVGQWMIQLTVVNQIDATSNSAELIGVLPHCLFLEDISKAVLQLDRCL